ncbi:hypothetical protein U1Q18_003224 [Sarracenia purpurea var. burkii]
MTTPLRRDDVKVEIIRQSIVKDLNDDDLICADGDGLIGETADEEEDDIDTSVDLLGVGWLLALGGVIPYSTSGAGLQWCCWVGGGLLQWWFVAFWYCLCCIFFSGGEGNDHASSPLLLISLPFLPLAISFDGVLPCSSLGLGCISFCWLGDAVGSISEDPQGLMPHVVATLVEQQLVWCSNSYRFGTVAWCRATIVVLVLEACCLMRQ